MGDKDRGTQRPQRDLHALTKETGLHPSDKGSTMLSIGINDQLCAWIRHSAEDRPEGLK